MKYAALGLMLAAFAMPAQAQDSPPASTRIIGEPAGSGKHPAVAEGRADAPGYTIYRPATPPKRSLPLVLWGNGGCSANGLSASHYLREIASHGYVVIANGAPGEERPPLAALPPRPTERVAPPAPPPGPPERAADQTTLEQYLGAIDWAERANRDPSDPLHGWVDTTRIAALGHSCGGLQALAAGADPRIDAVIALASGVYTRPGTGLSRVNIGKDGLTQLHTPVAYIIGGPDDIAYPNAADDFERIGHVPVFLANQPVGHGGTFSLVNGGDWARVSTYWLDWQLKGDEDAGRWFTGPACRLCTTYGWTIQRKQFPEAP